MSERVEKMRNAYKELRKFGVSKNRLLQVKQYIDNEDIDERFPDDEGCVSNMVLKEHDTNLTGGKRSLKNEMYLHNSQTISASKE